MKIYYLNIIKKHRMENRQDGNLKINQVLTYISRKKITVLNELIYAGEKLVCEKIEVPLKNTNKKSKPGWETYVRKLRKWAKTIKQRKNAGTCWDKKQKQYKKK